MPGRPERGRCHCHTRPGLHRAAAAPGGLSLGGHERRTWLVSWGPACHAIHSRRAPNTVYSSVAACCVASRLMMLGST